MFSKGNIINAVWMVIAIVGALALYSKVVEPKMNNTQA